MANMASLLHDQSERAAFKSDPKGYLKAAGVDIPDGKTVKVVEDDKDTKHVVLPPVRTEGELSDDELSAVSGAGGGGGDIQIADSTFCVSFSGWF